MGGEGSICSSAYILLKCPPSGKLKQELWDGGGGSGGGGGGGEDGVVLLHGSALASHPRLIPVFRGEKKTVHE